MHRVKGVLAAGLAAAALALIPTGASAQTGSGGAGSQFGHHVVACAQQMGFSGSHNPGMHQGFAGWNGMACPPMG